ncbi:outer membrane lipoprotein SlyB [Anoxybacillus tepidamans]|uniref:Outer membrane lipoprotein SlyB n=1 Tax=Anoxybacteroides tepidamans TaxID=265948 RepID=A0A7W8MW71_9BACL|nr:MULTISPECIES: hypothetical protein [Anoxybacillus]MBB5325046.1 outer membrane lipoprotein SlyB [Anoxybacillus tepidamans]MCZ0756377.1 hypothetical protein [Anoxybacillus sp. J5B_2022]
MSNYVELNEKELVEAYGGGLAGALIGGFLGAGIGFTAGYATVIAGLVSGKMTGKEARGVLKDMSMGGFGIGATIGGVSPTP